MPTGPYRFKLQLCGFICPECQEPLAHTLVRLYRPRNAKRITVLATADPKNTFIALSREETEAKSSSLIAEATTDERGQVIFELNASKKYDGEALEIDIACSTVPGMKEKPVGAPVQFTITTLQPQWRQEEIGLVAVWDHCIHARYWCRIRALLGAWVICGQVLHCETRKPIPGVKVTAFDRDWLQDDQLGSGLTDANGKFRIDYAKADFQPGTWVDVELIGGPDVYFHVETTLGTPLLVEPPSRGRQSDRENIGSCFCVELCLKEEVIPDPNEPLPVFTHVGGYHYLSAINSAPAGNGLTVADDRAFYATVRLNGILSKTLNGNPMEYQFETRELDSGGVPLSGWSVVAPGQIARTTIGLLEKFAPAFPGDPNPIKTQSYTVNGAPSPNEVVASIVDGWIRVPQESNVFGPQGFFVPNGNMIELNTRTLAPFADVNLTGLIAGNSSTSTGQPLVQNRHFAIQMRVREVGLLGNGTVAGICEHLAINNSLYDNILRHPAWMPVPLSNQLAVAMLDISQLTTNGCTEIADNLDVLFTAAHPTLGSVGISMAGPGGPYSFTVPPPGFIPGDRFGPATPNFVVSSLQACAYVVTLSVQVLLTTGDSGPDNLHDQIAFCKA